MHIEKQKNKLIIRGNEFSVSKTLECGQLFRYFRNDAEDYYVCSRDKRCRIIGYRDFCEIFSDDIEYFYTYFDLDTDYDSIFNELNKFPELREALQIGRGIRILRQDLFETIISFIISANNNIPRIKGIIERLCNEVGKNCGEYFAFPSMEEFMRLTAADYRRLGCGFRDTYLYDSVRELRYGDILDKLNSCDTATARKLLCSLRGIGPKVADCIILFGLGRFDTYPVDTWIFKACRTDELDTPAKVMKHFLDRYGDYAGYAQQFIYFAQRKIK